MALTKRTTIGSIIKGRDGKHDYIKISQDVTLKQGSFLNLENEKTVVKDLRDMVEKNKMDADYAEKRIAETVKYWETEIDTKHGKIKRKDMVRYSIVRVDKIQD